MYLSKADPSSDWFHLGQVSNSCKYQHKEAKLVGKKTPKNIWVVTKQSLNFRFSLKILLVLFQHADSVKKKTANLLIIGSCILNVVFWQNVTAACHDNVALKKEVRSWKGAIYFNIVNVVSASLRSQSHNNNWNEGYFGLNRSDRGDGEMLNCSNINFKGRLVAVWKEILNHGQGWNWQMPQIYKCF